MVIANVHVVPNMSLGEKKALLRRLHAALPEGDHAFSFLAGDWNFPAAGELRTNLLTGMPVMSPNPIGDFFGEIFAEWAEIEQDRPTRRQMEHDNDLGPRIIGCSRIDRIYSNLPTLELLDRKASAVTMSSFDNLRWPSDHVPVIATLAAVRDAPPRRLQLPRWIAKHDDFPMILNSVLDEVGVMLIAEPFERLEVITACYHEAASRLKMRNQEATTDGEVLHLLVAAARCWRVGALPRISTMRRRCNLLSEIFDCEGRLLDEEGLHSHIARLSAAAIMVQIEEMNGAGADQGDPAGAPRKANLHRQLAAWSPKRRR
eukprot:11123715-Heterocapsa_arctica.AAC.2